MREMSYNNDNNRKCVAYIGSARCKRWMNSFFFACKQSHERNLHLFVFLLYFILTR